MALPSDAGGARRDLALVSGRYRHAGRFADDAE
ncbi:hypothetical protein X753_31100 [Mesorhizobium sp. LNJC399B00]|nr:hypothetical protein X753_31100 [Mesorhizobium sp. LNJC399B00]